MRKKLREIRKRVFAECRNTYSTAEAEQEINKILSAYSPDCRVEFLEDAAKIKNAYLVTSSFDRHKVSAIISRTELTGRSYENISAEWRFHNIAYNMHIKRSSAVDADIDYQQDERWYVNLITWFMDILDIE